NCYAGPWNLPLTRSRTLQKLRRAVSNGADLIEIDVAEMGSTLCATHDDFDAANGRPELYLLLSDASPQASNALLVLEIKETWAPPEAFARHLLETLAEFPAYVRSGRPVVLKAFDSSVRSLTALKSVAARYPAVEPHLRYWVLFSEQ